jgi:hypothetical protein
VKIPPLLFVLFSMIIDIGVFNIPVAILCIFNIAILLDTGKLF